MAYPGDPLADTTGLDQPFVPTDPADLVLFRARQAAAAQQGQAAPQVPATAQAPAPAPAQEDLTFPLAREAYAQYAGATQGRFAPMQSMSPVQQPQADMTFPLARESYAQYAGATQGRFAPMRSIAPVQPTQAVEGEPTMAAAPVADDQAFDLARQSYAQYAGATQGRFAPLQSMSPPQQPGPQVPQFTDPLMYLAQSGLETGAETPPSPMTGFGERMQTTPLAALPPQRDLSALTDQLVGQVPMVGTRRVRLDADVERGVGQQEAALRKLERQYTGLETQASTLEDEYARRSDAYRAGLGELAARGEQMRGARGVERQIEAQQMAAAQMAFDANRVYQDLSQSPLQTGGLALAAGIVQGLQGYAGQDKPNAIMAAVQDAAQRDLANQVEQYKRMQAGQQVARNNFIEARQSLQDDQQALQVAAMATLDQITKGLEFIKARTLRAKERADIDVVIGKNRAEIGMEKTRLDSQAAGRELDAMKSNQDAFARIAAARQHAAMKMAELDQNSRQKAEDRIAQFIATEQGGAWSSALSGVAQFYQILNDQTQKGKTPEQLRGLIAQDTLSILREAFNAARGETGTSGAAYQAFNRVLSDGVGKMQSPEKREVMQAISSIYGAYARDQAGKSRTASELAQILNRVDPGNPDSVYRFVRDVLVDIDDKYKMQRTASGNGAAVWDATYGTRINVAKEINNQIVDAFETAAKFAQPPRKR